MGYNRLAMLEGTSKGVDCILVLRVRDTEELSERLSLIYVIEDSFDVTCVDAGHHLAYYVLHGVCDV